MESIFIERRDLSRVSGSGLHEIRPFTVHQFAAYADRVQSSQIAVVGDVAQGVAVARCLLLGSEYLFTSHKALSVGYVVYDRGTVAAVVAYQGHGFPALFEGVARATPWCEANALTDGTTFMCRECWDNCETYLISSGSVWPVVAVDSNCEDCGGSIG